MSLFSDWKAAVDEESSSRRCCWSVCPGRGLDYSRARREVAVGSFVPDMVSMLQELVETLPLARLNDKSSILQGFEIVVRLHSSLTTSRHPHDRGGESLASANWFEASSVSQWRERGEFVNSCFPPHPCCVATSSSVLPSRSCGRGWSWCGLRCHVFLATYLLRGHRVQSCSPVLTLIIGSCSAELVCPAVYLFAGVAVSSVLLPTSESPSCQW